MVSQDAASRGPESYHFLLCPTLLESQHLGSEHWIGMTWLSLPRRSVHEQWARDCSLKEKYDYKETDWAGKITDIPQNGPGPLQVGSQLLPSF